MSPALARVVVVEGRAFLLLLLDEFPRRGPVDALPLAHALYAPVDVGRDEDVDHILQVAQDVIGRPPHKHAAALVGRLADGFALKQEKTLLREVVLIEIVVAHKRYVGVEQRAEESPLLVVLLEKLLREAALLGREVEYFLVVEPAAELLGQLSGDDMPAAAYLSSDVNDDVLLVFHRSTLYVVS